MYKEYTKKATVKAKLFEPGDEDGFIHPEGWLGAMEDAKYGIKSKLIPYVITLENQFHKGEFGKHYICIGIKGERWLVDKEIFEETYSELKQRKVMKFCIERTINYVSEDRVIIGAREEDYFKRGSNFDVKYMCNVLIEVTRDFDINEQFPIVSDTDSIQIRPKGVFRSNKGYFHKGSKKERVYLNETEEQDMQKYILEARKHLKFIQ